MKQSKTSSFTTLTWEEEAYNQVKSQLEQI